MQQNFTQKEMLVRVMNKLDRIENKLNDTHQLAKVTNGKVGLHTKMIYGLGGVLVALTGWVVRFLVV